MSRALSPLPPPDEIPVDPKGAAKVAGLRYVDDDGPGIRRRRGGKGFSYRGVDGQPLRDRETLRWIRSLAIPPAWTDVWISPVRNGHILATGRDARRRKQYRYHPRWREVRDETKYNRTLAFAQALPAIRRRVDEDLARRGLPREKVLATVVRLMEKTSIRVGNEEYARDNSSYGLTTMRDKHVKVKGSTLSFGFRGKGGKRFSLDLNDPRLAAIVKRSQDLPGQRLFQYRDEDGVVQDIDSGDVNDYLREITGEDFTAKDFRTWAGTFLAAEALVAVEAVDSDAALKRHVVQAVEEVAKHLGNTPAVSRKSYIHPRVFEKYMDGSLATAMRERAAQELEEAAEGLSPRERAVMALLQDRLEQVESQSERRAG